MQTATQASLSTGSASLMHWISQCCCAGLVDIGFGGGTFVGGIGDGRLGMGMGAAPPPSPSGNAKAGVESKMLAMKTAAIFFMILP